MTTRPAPLWLRTILGFVIAPIVPGLMYACLDWLGDGKNRDILEVLALLGYSIALLAGAPLHLLLRWRGWNGWRTYIVAGPVLATIAFVTYIVLSASMLPHRPWIQNLPYLAWFLLPPTVALCTIGTLCFWLIARPDRVE